MENKGFKILLVDDSVLIVDRLANILKDLPCVESYYTAFDFEAAILILTSHEVNVAILDINLPGRNGIELLSFIKVNCPHIQNIMLTNQSDSYYRNLCNKLGADHFLDKTNEFEMVPDLINNYYVAHRH
jgi:DNA-binding NarL/FixJ family response regulator